MPVLIPMDQLSPPALLGVVDAFILREGTDYGQTDSSLEEKRSKVLAQLQSGEARIVYHPENEHIDITLTKD